MPFAITGYFDEICSQKIREIWKNLALNKIDDYMHKSANDPHFKLAMYDEINLETVAETLNRIASENGLISLIIKNYSFYLANNYVISLNIASTVELLNFQQNVKMKFGRIGKALSVDYFDRGKWQPDCPLTTSSFPMKKKKLKNAAEYLSTIELPISGKLEKIGIIEFHPAKKIFTVPLNH
jgi:hypothetical protein